MKAIEKPAGGAHTVTIMEAVENYVKPGLITAILKTGHDLVPVLDFTAPEATAGRLYKSARLLFPGFDNYLSTLAYEKLRIYELYRYMYQYPLKNGTRQYYISRIIDWANGSYQQELLQKLGLYYSKKPICNKKIWLLVERSVTKWIKENAEPDTKAGKSWEGADGFLII